MPDFPRLKNAPIQEGLIDLRTSFDSTPSERDLQMVAEELRATYPESSALQGLSTQIQLSDAGLSQHSLSPYRGVLLQSSDKSFVFQAQVDGFTLSKLRPYTNWNDLQTEAKRVWTVFEKHTAPTIVNRVAVRYINSFELPGPITNLRDYFEAPPELPAQLPQGLSSYLVRYQVPDADTGATVLLTQTMDEGAQNRMQFLIDIDVFKTAELDVNKKEWWELLALLRELKNRVFFASLTPKTRKRFE